MRDHVEKVHEGVIHSCQKCSFVAKTGANLRSHMRTHQYTKREKTNKCNQCSYAFFRPSNLKRHMMKHTGEKPYNCNQFSYVCSRPTDLKSHMIRHTGEELYKCDQCNNVYPWKESLRYHKKRHSEDCEDQANGVKSFKCAHCEYYSQSPLSKMLVFF